MNVSDSVHTTMQALIRGSEQALHLLRARNCWSNKPRNICQPQKPQRRPCSELLKYLTANDDSPQTKSTESRTNNRLDKCTKKKPCLHPQPHFQAKSTSLSLPLTPESPK
ncbi:unnamed protein product [Staurois parvus]|uniref:Uncharacterized protein n=1 Tax=Staurois parvus TaxID=386267 RepID=A0ABN9CTD9_9NEOB|nr:unnamed protein product [Staurois parvus]